jgi:hypothetical protein
MAEYGYLKIINNTTGYASNTCLDHIFMKCKSTKLSKPIVSPITITDHYSIFLSVGHLLTNINNTPNSLTISKINNFKLSDLIATQLWDNVLDKMDVNEATDNFINILKILMPKASISIKISSKLKKIKPWATMSLINANTLLGIETNCIFKLKITLIIIF